MKLPLVLLSLLCFCACRGPEKPLRPAGAEVIISSSHTHSRYCGHYLYGMRWFYLPQHSHGVACGHELVDGAWILKD
jgi:hypothetical protein